MTCLLLVMTFAINAQEKDVFYSEAHSTIYDEFNLFFENEIKRQGVKGNWIFRLEEVYGFHQFDANGDLFVDALIEFSAISVEGEATINHYTVLLLNDQGEKFKYFDYIDTNEWLFSRFEEGKFSFVKRNLQGARTPEAHYEIRGKQFSKKLNN